MSGDIHFRKLPPVWFIKILNSFRYGLLYLNRSIFPGNIVLYEHFQYLWLLPCIRIAAELNIAGILKDQPRTISELASLTGSNPEYLFRIMRALTGNGIFKLKKDGRYVNSSMSKALIDGKGSLRYMIMQHLGNFNWGTFNELIHAVRTGNDAVTKVYGKGIYDYLSEHPDESELFTRSMSNLSELSIEPILSAYDFSKYGILADIGGGEGLLLSAIIHEYPGLKGILFDRKESITKAESIFIKFGVKEKIKTIPGDFFESAPDGADVYLLKNILHNWSDEDCVRILNIIKKILPDKGKILIMEMVINEDNKPSFSKLIDIQMMVFMKGGKERTRSEYETILTNAGFRINKIIPTIAPISIIEAIKL
jgi:hypothetical protein